MRRSLVALLFAVMPACTAHITDGQFICNASEPCPSGFACATDGRCRLDEFDAGDGASLADGGADAPALLDAPALPDAAGPDAVVADGGVDGGCTGMVCMGTCFDTTHDPLHCGGCETACGWACTASACDHPTQISVGGDFACALRTSGSIDCWGYNMRGDLGIGATSMYEPTPLGSTPGLIAMQIDTGSDHACAVTASGGGVLCWGDNASGQVGNGAVTVTPVTTATTVVDMVGMPVATATQVATGTTHSCALLSSGVVCWGENGNGQLGSGATSVSARPHAGPVVGLPSPGVEIACGAAHTCARMADRSVYCWGSNSSGQLGRGTTTLQEVTPAPVSMMTDAVEITVGDDYTCARRLDNSVWCWGENSQRQLGDGSTSPRSSPVMVGSVSGAVELSGGSTHACARLTAGSVICWGSNNHGEIGNGTMGSPADPVSATLTGATAIAAGLDSTCATDSSHVIHCWGANDYGQLGIGVGSPGSTTPRVVSSPLR